MIGSGTFGKVYLGMDASTGLLMAVKQIETFQSRRQGGNKSGHSLIAIEREINLLKRFKHENIVQYLCTYTRGHSSHV